MAAMGRQRSRGTGLAKADPGLLRQCLGCGHHLEKGCPGTSPGAQTPHTPGQAVLRSAQTDGQRGTLPRSSEHTYR